MIDENAALAEIERARAHDRHLAGAEAMRLRAIAILAKFQAGLRSSEDKFETGKLCSDLIQMVSDCFTPILSELAAWDADKANV